LNLIIIMFYCHICILHISTSPMIYTYIIKYEGKVWEGELTVGNSELDMCRVFWELPRVRDVREGPEKPCE